MSDSSGRKPRLRADKRYPSKGPSTARKKTTAPKKPAPKKKRPAARRKPVRRGPIGYLAMFLRWIVRLVVRIGVTVTAVIALLVGIGVYYYNATLPPVQELLDGRARGSVTMLDNSGAVFAWRGQQFGGAIDAKTVSPHLRNAVVATEDKRFYRHFGVSPRGIASAVRINLSEGRGPLSGHGGSTITQQTAKLLCLGTPYNEQDWKSERAYEAECREGSLWRKIKEATYAIAMEVKYSKDEILTIYLNRAFLGEGSRGFEAASQRYFGKSANEVAPAEAAMLAGLLVAPSRYAPTNNLERSQRRAATVIRLMEEQDYLTAAQAQDAQANPAVLSDAAEAEAGGYFADWVMSSGPEFFTRNTTEDVIIRTTMDQRIQKAAEDAMTFIFENKVREGSKAQAAIVVMSADGAVRAMVGGRRTKVSGVFNRASQAKRQTGSSFKPFVYATAMEMGYSPLDTIRDEPFCMNIPGSGEWCPKNYTKDYKGQVTLTEALKRSLNIPAVKISESLGRDLVQKVARDFGIESALADSPAMALGASEATLIEMVGAYAGILNGGSSVTPYGLVELKLLGDDTPLMDTTGGIGERVIQKEAAESLIYMMEKVVSEGSGRRAALPDRPAAGKTGTTQAARDAWFIGFTADYVAGVWMGYDDNTPLTGVTGSGLPAEIWHETMVRVHKGLPVRELPMKIPARPAPAPEPQNPQQTQRRPSAGNGPDTVLEQVLRDLFGGGRSN
ncbi:PBP1A family penicillin-binding protein [Marinovum sp. 2_MG-2023]|uniref:transglycosylase domain-containing protein n=1 Tax=unclassified Marinovum TaxID=2647166 RepID=UPI0026E45863|nr:MULTISPECIES: PBP1A family penicillin-binding protein [unclassified Marinovum]MDO6732694.1 PBP1A family penicillin-binding protein [Marinovum sp. 2_MG-2023]MDO6781990.1 PBP1A family penicillin-binding protein [Marinovum sp. 1_MG-2023]